MARVAHIALKATRIWRYSTVRAILRTNSGTSMPQSTLARQRERRLEQASDLRVRVEIRARSLRAIRQQAWGRDLRPGIGRTSMPRKPTNKTQSVRPLSRLHALGCCAQPEVPDFVKEVGSSGWTRTNNPPVNRIMQVVHLVGSAAV